MWYSAREHWFPSQLHLHFNWVDAGTKLDSTESASALKTGDFNQRHSKKNPQVFTHASCSAAHFWSHNHSLLSGQKNLKNLLKMFLWFPLEEQQQNPASKLLTHIFKIPKDLDKIYPIHTIRNRNARRAMSPQTEIKLMSEQEHYTVTMRPFILSYRRHHSHWHLSSRCVWSVITWISWAAGFILGVHIIASFL